MRTDADDGCQTLSDGTITICWSVPGTEGSLPVTGYVVQYQQDDDNTAENWDNATTVQITTPTQTSFEHENVQGGSSQIGGQAVNFTWEYRVQAVNGNGGGVWLVFARIESPARGPDAPELTATTLGPRSIRLEWTVPGNNGSTIDGYNIQQLADDGMRWETEDLLADATDSGDTTLLIVDELSPNTEYYFRIQAQSTIVNTVTPGAWSGGTDTNNEKENATPATTMMAVPNAPVLAAATGEAADGVGSVRLTLALATMNGGAGYHQIRTPGMAQRPVECWRRPGRYYGPAGC